MFEVWDEHGHAIGLTLQALKVRISNDYRGDLMVRYSNKLGLPTTLFLTIHQGVAYQRFKAGSPKLDWEWLAGAGNGHSPRDFMSEQFPLFQLSLDS
ncbi:hypothetical protein BJP24_10895 [Aeromonas allosaccharophila]|uniref:hypothetical protein n=1 Tax=Aeromonas allosaccharophila TaxID=656 RepID=UPI0005B20ADD|nr:hypothetical protein [Aeromonas allosaccharophila]OKP44442.1 hypothetical protein BJP24_10895 [Aeromonas allosaccharophila]